MNTKYNLCWPIIAVKDILAEVEQGQKGVKKNDDQIGES